MSRGEVKIDQEKYKHNENYRKYIQSYFKNDLVQPFTKGDQRNPEFIKRYGTGFYKAKPKIHTEEEPKKKGVTLHRSKWSVFS